MMIIPSSQTTARCLLRCSTRNTVSPLFSQIERQSRRCLCIGAPDFSIISELQVIGGNIVVCVV